MKGAKRTPRQKPRLKHIVCKPCWELKYCPYGPLVEYFPLVSEDYPPSRIRRRYNEIVKSVLQGKVKDEEQLHRFIEAILCLEPNAYAWITKYRTEELQCSVFGHICPVFFSAEPLTETREDRRLTRQVPREVMLKVVRRDGQVCRICQKNVLDDEIEFDHIIPHSKGGPTTPENLRVLCRACNRKKRDTLKELLSDDPLRILKKRPNKRMRRTRPAQTMEPHR